MLSVLVPLLIVQYAVSETNGEEENKTSLEGRHKACDVLVAFDESLYKEHDGNIGKISSAMLSYDERFLVSTAYDGLIFVHTIDKFMIQ